MVRMSTQDTICRPTKDTFVRFGIVLAAFLGFSLYFVYDGVIGYRHHNAVYFSYNAFVKAGQEADKKTPEEWATTYTAEAPLIEMVEREGNLCASKAADKDGEEMHYYPLPQDSSDYTCTPDELRDHAAMVKSWNDCWKAYSERMRYAIKPVEHPYDEATIREQFLAAGVCMLFSLIITYLIIRTARRRLAIEGDEFEAVGGRYKLADISRIDLRQWGPGQKGVAYFTVHGRKLRIDGMTYGGFDKKKGEPAETFMKAILAQYQGEIVDYEQEHESEPERRDS